MLPSRRQPSRLLRSIRLPRPSSRSQSNQPVPAEPVADIAAPSPRAAKPSASSSSSLAGEIQLMHDVESALSAGQPGRALQLLDDAAKVRTRRSVRRNDG